MIIVKFIQDTLSNMDLKKRLATAAVGLVFLTTAIMTFSGLALLRNDLRESITIQQTNAIEHIANDLDDKLEQRQKSLLLLSSQLSLIDQSDPDAIEKFLEKRNDLAVLFDNITVYALNGDLIANIRTPGSRFKLNFSDKDYFQETFKTQKGVISKPVASQVDGHPIILITSPVFNTAGKLINILTGIIDLNEDGFLSAVANTKIGKTGYYFIITSDGTFVSHPIKTRVLKNVYKENLTSQTLTAALNGYEGTIESVNSLKVKGLFSYKKLHATNWVLTAVYPSSEAFAPITNIEMQGLLLALVLAIVVGPLAWYLIRFQLKPLGMLEEHIKNLGKKGSTSTHALINSKSEIGQLERAFDDLMEKRIKAEENLEKRTVDLESAAESSLDSFCILTTIKNVEGEVVDFRFRYVNVNFALSIGKTADALVGKKYSETFENVTSEPYFPMYVSAVVTGKNAQAEYALNSGGDLRWFSHQVVPIAEGLAVTTRDITPNKKAEKKLMENEALLRGVTDNLPALVSYIDKDRIFRFNNQQYASFLHKNIQDITNKTLLEVYGQEHYALFEPYLNQALLGETVSFEIESALSGKVTHYKGYYVPEKNNEGQVQGVYGMLTDVSAMKKVENQLRISARYDALTSLPNRSHYEDEVEKAIARSERNGTSMALLFIDIDNFKGINDNLGHLAGDDVLCEFSKRLSICIRRTDTVARLAGDEFIIILEGMTQPEGSMTVAEKIVEQMKQPFILADNEVCVTASIGIAVRKKGEVISKEILAKADKALYEAKSLGKNSYCTFTDQ